MDCLQQVCYIHRLRQIVRENVMGCPECQQSKPSRRLPPGQLNPIEVPQQPHVTQTLDFIVQLPVTSTEYDAILTVTDAFTKWIRTVPGRTDWDARDWAEAYFEQVYAHTGLPAVMISDRDPKFTSSFWNSLTKRMGIKLAMTTAYHPQANGQSERTNQTVEAALRTMLANRNQDELKEWDDYLPEVTYALNTSVNRSTNATPFLLQYGVHPRSNIDPAVSENPAAKDFFQERRRWREEAQETLDLAKARMAQVYNSHHLPMEIGDKVYIRLAKKLRPGYKLASSTALDAIKIGPFPVKSKVSTGAYELDLPAHMKIHPVIAVIHLEPANPDPYEREIQPPPPVLVDGEERYVIDKLLKKERRREPGDKQKRVYYKVRWAGYPDPKDDRWLSEDDLLEQVPGLVENFKPNQRIRRS